MDQQMLELVPKVQPLITKFLNLQRLFTENLDIGFTQNDLQKESYKLYMYGIFSFLDDDLQIDYGRDSLKIGFKHISLRKIQVHSCNPDYDEIYAVDHTDDEIKEIIYKVDNKLYDDNRYSIFLQGYHDAQRVEQRLDFEKVKKEENLKTVLIVNQL
jgi:hypothetical protein